MVKGLEDFCDIEALFTILDNWSKSTGLSAILIDNNGNPASKSYGMSPFCQLIHSTEEGKKRCHDNWKEKSDGIHVCHAGFYDFSIPLILPDGTELGKILAGQMLSTEQDTDDIIKNIKGIGLYEYDVKNILGCIPRKDKAKLEGSYELLKQIITFFLEKSYASYIEKEAYRFDISMLSAALKTVYRIIMLFNVTKNQYHLIDYKKGVQQIVPGAGTIDKIVDIGVQSIPDEGQAKEYYRLFNRDALIETYKKGTKELILQYKQTIFNGDVHWMEGRLIFVESNNDEIHCICLNRVIDDEIQNKLILNQALDDANKQKKLLQEALDNYKQADYDRRIDFLTGLRNRQDMFDLFNDSLSGKRSQIKSMFMMDIDNFKSLNDTYGHSYGDDCLSKIGNALITYGKKNNIYFYRYGGEEILGISFGSDKEDSQIAEELVEIVSDLMIKRDDTKEKVVTVSVGYTTDNSRYEKMIDKADSAMYKAKNNGKNQAVCFEKI